MIKLATAMLLLSAPAFAQTAAVDCPPIGQTAKGEMVYGMDCKSLKPENRAEIEPNMPRTTMKETVIPKLGRNADAGDHADHRGQQIAPPSRTAYVIPSIA
ncbi:MAG: hypothetical protein JWQ07_5740 [Ramlibacter sp.]|nr:hypothetical protein [Ramlibacter sp.]